VGALAHRAHSLWVSLPAGGSLPHDSWRRRHQVILVLLWLHALGLFALALALGNGLAHSLTEGGIVAAFAVAATFGAVGPRVRAALASLGLISASAVLVHLTGGYIEMHFHFFVMVVVISLYQDWVPFLLAIGYVVAHHGVIGVLDPAGVYNHPDAWAHPWKWAAIHGVFVLGASAAAIVNWRLNERARAQSELLLQSAGEGIYGVDRQGTVTFINVAGAAMLGWEPDLIGRSVHEVLHQARPAGSGAPREVSAIDGALRDGATRHDDNEIFWHRGGRSFPVEYTCTPIRERGALVGAVVTFQDITERKRYEEQLTHQALFDSLTELPNRRLFLDRLAHALARAARAGEPVAVLFMDLDR
jgi:PAS domain S-box-containing protein